jgi:hypothetical protein
MNAFLIINIHPRPGRERGDKEKKMNTQTETKPSETKMEIENPMQERSFGEVAESLELPAETAFAARRTEVGKEAGSVFVP